MTAQRTIPNGLVVVFDGIDGVGKTTQLKLAQTDLESAGWAVHATRNLGGTPIGEELRQVIKSTIDRPAKTNLHIAVAIQEALTEVIKKQRNEGKIILLDRGPLSLAAYEIYGSGLDEELGWPYVQAALDEVQPELTLIYEVNEQIAFDRVQHQQGGRTDYFESQPLEYFEKVAQGYRTASKHIQATTEFIDAAQSVEEIHEQTMRLINQVIDGKNLA